MLSRMTLDEAKCVLIEDVLSDGQAPDAYAWDHSMCRVCHELFDHEDWLRVLPDSTWENSAIPSSWMLEQLTKRG